ncbi:M14 family metallopeptidase [Thiohalocapsa sp. ML1]|uniref:M14 family metallopeptidase n=1 Tax=Thiohalocapsa sp. ML1 TaxID=1431688 RepID=UPI000B334193|nr:M14 family metallopeptidase [Thiohalocapsa sp. ML1]
MLTDADTAADHTPDPLIELDALPPGILDCDAASLTRLLDGPTLIELPGQREPALFVSVLMHGNETVGWEAIRRLLRDFDAGGGDRPLPRALALFIGNVRAAAAGMRHLPEQPDFNRVWPGTELPETRIHGVMQQVVERMAARGLFASIDLHNNTGTNPHYACVNVIDNRYLHLATLFSRTVVHFTRPRGVQSHAMAALCPAVTVECGKVQDQLGVDHALEFIDACLHLARFPEGPVPAHDIDLFHTVAQIKVPTDIDFALPPASAPLVLSPTLEHLNFRELPVGTAFGSCAAETPPVDVRDEWGRDVTRRYFTCEDGELRLKLPVMPSMLTCDVDVIRQDCLGYLLERYDEHLPPRG